ncbi:MAG: response regulator [Thermoanaerobaculia bacterium]|nr:response regulator [Thermoanaerobaculia bacterium]
MNIIVVDDEVQLLEIWKRLFEVLGVSISTATNGVEAVEVMQQQTIDLLITDIRMPLADGFHVLRYAFSEQVPPPATFVCSGYIHDEPTVLAPFQIVRVIPKPFSFAGELEYFRSYLAST